MPASASSVSVETFGNFPMFANLKTVAFAAFFGKRHVFDTALPSNVSLTKIASRT